MQFLTLNTIIAIRLFSLSSGPDNKRRMPNMPSETNTIYLIRKWHFFILECAITSNDKKDINQKQDKKSTDIKTIEPPLENIQNSRTELIYVYILHALTLVFELGMGNNIYIYIYIQVKYPQCIRTHFKRKNLQILCRRVLVIYIWTVIGTSPKRTKRHSLKRGDRRKLMVVVRCIFHTSISYINDQNI